MNISEYYEYKKDNDKQIADFNAQKEQEEKKQKKERAEGEKEKIKKGLETATTVITQVPNFVKVGGTAAILGAIASAYDKIKGNK